MPILLYLSSLKPYFIYGLYTLSFDLDQKSGLCNRVASKIHQSGRGKMMLQAGDKSILLNVAKVIAILVVVMFVLIFLASYIGGGQ